jgi:lipopolysaccharide transport protein LptA
MSTETPAGADGSSSSPAADRRDSVYRPGGRRDARYGRRRQRRTRYLRASLLVLLIAGMAGLALVFLSGRPDGPPVIADETAPEAAGTGEATAAGEETVQLSAEQFESTLEREGVEVFRIRGARTSSDNQGNVLLKEVEIDYPRGDDDYRLRADGATYNEVTNATHLEGAVVLEGTNGLTVATDWMDLAEGGMILTAADDSRLTFEGMTAVGDGLRVDFRQETAHLSGGVTATGTATTSETGDAPQPLALTAETLEYRWREGRMRAAGAATMEFGHSPEPLSVTADRLEYRWNEGTLTGRGGTTARFGDLDLTARTLTLALARDTADRLTSLEARGEIVLQAPLGNGGLRPQDGDREAEGSAMVLAGQALDVGFDTNQLPSRLLLSGPNRGGPGVLRIDYADGARRRVRAQVLAFDFKDGLPSGFEARGRVVLDEQVPQQRQPLRIASSRVANGRFDSDGGLTELVLEGSVELTDRSRDPVRALADRAEIDPVTGRVALAGEPARLILADGELEAPSAVFHQAAACSEARGGVVIAFRSADEDGGGPLPLAGVDSTDGPWTIRSEEALVCAEDDSRFRGEVEAFTGEYYLAAAQLQVSGDRKRLVATGDVRTTWRSPSGLAPTDAEELEVEATEEWLVVSERMAFSEDDGELRYSGNASASLGDQRLDCDELTVEVAAADEDGQARALYCLGNARLQDAAQEVSAGANRVVYVVGERVVRLTGAVVVRGGGDLLRGSRLVYWLDEGRYEMGPSGGAAAGAGSP